MTSRVFHCFSEGIVFTKSDHPFVQLQLTCEAFALPVPDNIVSDNHPFLVVIVIILIIIIIMSII